MLLLFLTLCLPFSFVESACQVPWIVIIRLALVLRPSGRPLGQALSFALRVHPFGCALRGALRVHPFGCALRGALRVCPSGAPLGAPFGCALLDNFKFGVLAVRPAALTRCAVRGPPPSSPLRPRRGGAGDIPVYSGILRNTQKPFVSFLVICRATQKYSEILRSTQKYSEILEVRFLDALRNTQNDARSTQKHSGTTRRNLWVPQERSKTLRNIFVSFLVMSAILRSTQKYSEILRSTQSELGNTQKCSGRFRCSDDSEVLRNIQKYSGVLRNTQKYSEVLRNIQKYSEVLRSIQKYSEVLRNAPVIVLQEARWVWIEGVRCGSGVMGDQPSTRLTSLQLSPPCRPISRNDSTTPFCPPR